MKKHFSKKSLWQSLLSMVVLVIFIFLAGSSEAEYELLTEMLEYRNEHLGKGYYRETDVNVHWESKTDVITTTTGFRGVKYGNWQGEVRIKEEKK